MATRIAIAPMAGGASRQSLRAVRAVLRQTLALEGEANALLSVAFVDKTTIKNLNRRFRKKNRATNVLSFPGSGTPLTRRSHLRDLGEIIICPTYTHEEALAAGMAAEVRLAHLLIHGALHLLGYDHETSAADRRRMEARENKLLAGLAKSIFKALRPLLPAERHLSRPKKNLKAIRDQQR